MDLSTYLNQPLFIGARRIEGRLVLAPMTFLGHVAFRELISHYGGYGLLFSEMCSAKTVPQENRFVSAFFKWRDEERSKLVFQISGAEPKTMASAASRIETEDLFGVDINFGCSTAQICKQNCGAAVLKDPGLAAKIVAAVRSAVAIPVFVKFRTGWKDDVRIPVDMAKRFEDAGADALTFHPRVAPDRRARRPKWEYIRLVKEAVQIPVFGNGNVFDCDDCRRMIQQTGCDGVALGRMAIAKPWIFAEWTAGLKTSPQTYHDAAVRLSKLLEIHYEPVQALRRFKRFSFYFCANFQFGHTLYSKILRSKDLSDMAAILAEFFSNVPMIVSRPNMNYFQ